MRIGVFSSKKRMLVVAALLLAAVILFALTRPGGRKTERESSAATPIDVSVLTVSSADLPDEVSASGTVRPVMESHIAPKIMSNVAAVYAREGDRVRRGQVLMRLESRDLAAQVAQAQAALTAAMAGSRRAYTAVDLKRAETSTGVASAQAALAAAREQLSIAKEGPRKQQKIQAQLAVTQAEAQFKNAEVEMNRMKRLYEQDVVPKQRYDGAQTLYDVAKAQYESAKQQADLTEEGSRKQDIRTAEEHVRQAEEALRMAKASGLQTVMSKRSADEAASGIRQARAAVQFANVQLSYATITAPISGIVTARTADPGDTVSPGVPIISVEDDSLYRLEATVPDRDASNLVVGQIVNVTIGTDKVSSQGRVSVISPSGDPSSRKFVMKIDLPKTANARSGNFGRMSFAVGHSMGVVIPESALRDEGGLTFVFVVGKDNRARMQVVKPGRDIHGGVEILSGLMPGDQVVTWNTGVISDGVPVRVRGEQ